MTAKKENKEASAETPLPNSCKAYVAGKVHVDLRVPFREISLAPTKTMSGEIEVNEPVRVYDTSGSWGDVDQHIDVTKGLPALRAKWIRDRGDVEETEGRPVKPIDDGYLSEKHAASAAQKRPAVARLRRVADRGSDNESGAAVAAANGSGHNSNGSNGNGNSPSSLILH